MKIKDRIINEDYFTIKELDAMETRHLKYDPWCEKGYVLKYSEEFHWQIYFNPETNHTVVLHYEAIPADGAYDYDWKPYYSYIAT